MTTKSAGYIQKAGLVESREPKTEKIVYRRPGFGGILTDKEMDEKIASALRKARDEQKLTRAELAPLLGLAEQVYGRYERSVSKLHVTQLIHLSEILGFAPDDLLFAAAPHLWGETPEEASKRRRLIKLIEDLPGDTLNTVLTLMEAILRIQQSVEPSSST
ncbi:helix-turn-helix transcriptional regulator [Ensifer sp. YR511]|uniref:helix-turn-helix transcriptional regulator n=1 Tax=Ensifer sp. YR511 TaxID=1855294 RepID=UPI00088B95C6|nr:helix-turn-helix transcriptional regulator [Ensifer sp. YR511]SDN95994.1 Helix-turn-helix [Ensifer sp. YR511]